MGHIPVLATETIAALNIEPNKTYIDGTLGGGGHSKLILERLNKQGKLYSFDQDKEAIARVQNEAEKYPNWTLVHRNFAEIFNYCKEHLIQIDGGLLLDLGLSSFQLDDPRRGFSFQYNAELDMRLNPDSELSAADVINSYSEKELADIIYKYGEERKSRIIAKAIVQNRPFDSTTKLADLIKTIYARGSHGRSFRIAPATQTFQALRIYINQELTMLEKILELDFKILKSGARIAVISFHSLEDRIVKHKFRALAQAGKIALLTKKPIIPSEEECKSNPRARSAKLRICTIV